VLCDLKTGAPTKTDPMQLCAYEHMDGYKADELMDLYLDADGGEAGLGLTGAVSLVLLAITPFAAGAAIRSGRG